jgi:glutaredoxin-like YruB-family protein
MTVLSFIKIPPGTLLNFNGFLIIFYPMDYSENKFPIQPFINIHDSYFVPGIFSSKWSISCQTGEIINTVLPINAFINIRRKRFMENVTVYTTPTCPWCTKVKSYLKNKGVDYNEIDVVEDTQAAQRMVELTGQRSVPVITIGERYIVGYDPDRIDSMLH